MAEIAEMTQKVVKKAGEVAGVVEKVVAPDDGKPHTCWLKSHGRGFGSIPSGLFSKSKGCKEGKEMSGGLCYKMCEEGHGVGPVCWGACPTGTTACGVLC